MICLSAIGDFLCISWLSKANETLKIKNTVNETMVQPVGFEPTTYSLEGCCSSN